MKKGSLSLLWVCIAAFSLLTSCDKEGGVEVKGINGIHVTGIHEGVLSMKADLLIHNSTNHKVVVRKLDATVFYGGAEGGTITVTEKIRMPAHSEQVYAVPVDVTLSHLGSMIKAFVESAVNRQKKELHLRGTLKVRSGILLKKIPFDEKQKINGF